MYYEICSRTQIENNIQMIEALLNLKAIIHTLDGYEIRNLKWNKMDNIIVGQVKDPFLGRPNLHDGYVTCTWYKNGKTTPKYGGINRKDLYLKMEYAD